VLVQRLNPQPGGPGYLSLSDLSPSPCPARKTLPVAMLPPVQHSGMEWKAMEYGSRKALSDVLKPRNIYIKKQFFFNSSSYRLGDGLFRLIHVA
jgi:hypothetical protein